MREPTYFVLASLLDRPLHGYAIIKRAAETGAARMAELACLVTSREHSLRARGAGRKWLPA